MNAVHAGRVVEWLPEQLRAEAAELLQTGCRVSQEALRRTVLDDHQGWRAGLD